jgi:DNA-binding XRE family transcriptional regulator
MLRAARSLAGLSQQELADRGSISRRCLTAWEGSSGSVLHRRRAHNFTMTLIRVTGSQLHAARVLVGLSREVLAEPAGLCRHTICKWETSSHAVRGAMCGHLCRVVDVLNAAMGQRTMRRAPSPNYRSGTRLHQLRVALGFLTPAYKPREYEHSRRHSWARPQAPCANNRLRLLSGLASLAVRKDCTNFCKRRISARRGSRLVRAVPLVAVVRERGSLVVVATTEWGAIQFAVQSNSIIASLLLGVGFLQRIAAHSGTWGASRSEKCRRAGFRDANVAVGELVALSFASTFCGMRATAVPASTPAAAGRLPPSHQCRPGTRRRWHIPCRGFVLPHSMTSSNRADNRQRVPWCGRLR